MRARKPISRGAKDDPVKLAQIEADAKAARARLKGEGDLGKAEAEGDVRAEQLKKTQATEDSARSIAETLKKAVEAADAALARARADQQAANERRIEAEKPDSGKMTDAETVEAFSQSSDPEAFTAALQVQSQLREKRIADAKAAEVIAGSAVQAAEAAQKDKLVQSTATEGKLLELEKARREAKEKLTLAEIAIETERLKATNELEKATREGGKNVGDAQAKETKEAEEKLHKARAEADAKAKKELDSEIKVLEAELSKTDGSAEFAEKVHKLAALKKQLTRVDPEADRLTPDALSDLDKAADESGEKRIAEHDAALDRKAEAQKKKDYDEAKKAVDEQAKRHNRKLTPEQEERSINRELELGGRRAEHAAELAQKNKTGAGFDDFFHKPKREADAGPAADDPNSPDNRALDQIETDAGNNSGEGLGAAAEKHKETAGKLSGVAEKLEHFGGELRRGDHRSQRIRHHLAEHAERVRIDAAADADRHADH